MKFAACRIILLSALACLLHQASAQRNWWEVALDGSTTIASSRTTTTPTPSTQAPPASTTECPCLTTPEYNPVCGDLGGNNRLTYTSPARLECAQRCGTNVQLLFYGRCEKVA